MELSEQDRQRIEQANPYLYLKQSSIWREGAEYEHKYQREQQAELRNRVEFALRLVIRHGLLEIDGYETVLKEVHEALNSLKK